MPAFAEEFSVFVKSLNEDAAKKLAQAARDGEAQIIAQQRARRGDSPGEIHAVDGDQNKSYDAVKPDGIIVQLFDYRAEIIHACFQELQARAPVVTGLYRRSFFAMLDGQGLEPLTVPPAAQLQNVTRIAISNNVPYAMRLETGTTKTGRPFTHAPHIVEGAMQVVRREFNAVAKISYGVVALEGAYQRKTGVSSRKNRRSKRGAGSEIQYPAIIIEPL